MTQKFTLFFTSLILITLFHNSYSSPYHCHHDKLDLSVHIAHEHHDHHDHPAPQVGRVLQSSNYSNIKIYADFSLISSEMNSTLADYVQNELIASAVLYYQQTLLVVPRGKNLSTNKDTLCGIATPSVFLNDGVDADIGFIVNAAAEDSDYVAYARACTLSSIDNRPIFGNVHLNLNYLRIGTIMEHEQNLNVAIHEMAHVFGISKGLFQYYYNVDTGRVRTGHIKSKVVNGVTSVVIDLDPLTSKLREFYGCSQIDGVLMENQGDVASTNSHFERRIFYHEIMTASEIEGARISDFMLAFLEGTGWYKGNYSMTEPVYWGKEKGCDFYYGSCMTQATAGSAPVPNFDEFCSNLQEVGCSADRRYAATCGGSAKAKQDLSNSSFNYWGDGTVVADIFSDNCPYFETDSNIDCQDPDSQGLAFLNTEVFGSGSKCFTGNIGGASAKRTYCLKATCELQSDSSYFMKITLGNTVATCKDAGSLFVDGYNGEIDCPDPNEYCSTFGSNFCGKGCMGRGQCVNNTCQCEDGWGGNDCGSKVYVDKCERCADNILETACYGDGCSQMPVVTDDNDYDGPADSLTSGGSSSNVTKDAGHFEVVKLILILGMIVSIVF